MGFFFPFSFFSFPFYDFCKHVFKGKVPGVQRALPTGVPQLKKYHKEYFRALDKMMNGPGME